MQRGTACLLVQMREFSLRISINESKTDISYLSLSDKSICSFAFELMKSPSVHIKRRSVHVHVGSLRTTACRWFVNKEVASIGVYQNSTHFYADLDRTVDGPSLNPKEGRKELLHIASYTDPSPALAIRCRSVCQLRAHTH